MNAELAALAARRDVAQLVAIAGQPDDVDRSHRRVAAIVLLGRLRASECVPTLADALAHSKSNVRLAAADALKKIGTADAAEPLRAVLGDWPEIQLRALGGIKDHVRGSDFALIAPLASAGVTREVRVTAALLLGRIASDESVAALASIVERGDSVTAMAAAGSLGELSDLESAREVRQRLARTAPSLARRVMMRPAVHKPSRKALSVAARIWSARAPRHDGR